MDPLEEDAFDWVESLMDDGADFDSLEVFDDLETSPESIINTCNIQPLGDFPPLDAEDAAPDQASSSFSSDTSVTELIDPTIVVKTEFESAGDITDKFQDPKERPGFPALRLKSIMKLDPNLDTVGREASALMSFAAQLFIDDVTEVSWAKTENRKCSVMNRTDVVTAIEPLERFDFLADIVPYWDTDEVETDDSGEDQQEESSTNDNLQSNYGDQESNDHNSDFFEQVSSFESKDVS